MIQPPKKIWQKFSDKERAMYVSLYKIFVLIDNYSPKTKITKIDRAVVAYNCALQAVWFIQAIFPEECRKMAGTTKHVTKKEK
jgi:hypothetical protein